jgi:hypothetical protein
MSHARSLSEEAVKSKGPAFARGICRYFGYYAYKDKVYSAMYMRLFLHQALGHSGTNGPPAFDQHGTVKISSADVSARYNPLFCICKLT